MSVEDYSDPYSFLFDEDKALKAAAAVKIFQDVSVGSSKEKMREAGEQERETIGKGAEESRISAREQQQFKQQDEDRDYGQAQRAYRYWAIRRLGWKSRRSNTGIFLCFCQGQLLPNRSLSLFSFPWIQGDCYCVRTLGQG